MKFAKLNKGGHSVVESASGPLICGVDVCLRSADKGGWLHEPERAAMGGKLTGDILVRDV